MTLKDMFDRYCYLQDGLIEFDTGAPLDAKDEADFNATVAVINSLAAVLYDRIPEIPNFSWSGDKAQATLFYTHVRGFFNPNGEIQ